MKKLITTFLTAFLTMPLIVQAEEASIADECILIGITMNQTQDAGLIVRNNAGDKRVAIEQGHKKKAALKKLYDDHGCNDIFADIQKKIEKATK